MFVKLREHLRQNWKVSAGYGLVFLVVGIALYWQLGSLLPGYSEAELQTYHNGLSFKNIFENPFNAPFLLASRLLLFITDGNLLTTRLVATIGGLGTLAVFTTLVRSWHNNRTATLSTLLFGLSAWFLHVSRSGTPEILLFGVFLLAAAGFWLRRTNNWLALFVCFLLVTSLLYVPGMIWFIVFGIIWQWKTIDQVFKKHLAAVSVGALVMLAALTPLALALYKNHSLIKPLLGIPNELPSITTMLSNIIEVPFHFLVYGERNPEMWLGTAPIFEVFSLVLLLFGSYLYFKKIKLIRTPLFISIFIITTVLIAMGSGISFTVILPFAYIIIAAGLSNLLGRWFTVFPRNPIARTIGWGSIGVVMVLAISFHLNHYFIGWPHAKATDSVYHVQKP